MVKLGAWGQGLHVGACIGVVAGKSDSAEGLLAKGGMNLGLAFENRE